MSRTDDQTAIDAKKAARHPVEFDRYVGASIDERPDHPAGTHNEGRDHCATFALEFESHAVSTIGQRGRPTDQACRLSHW